MNRILKPGKLNLVWRLTGSEPVRVYVRSHGQWLALCTNGETYEVDVQAGTAIVAEGIYLTIDGYVRSRPLSPAAQTALDEAQAKLDAATVELLAHTKRTRAISKHDHTPTEYSPPRPLSFLYARSDLSLVFLFLLLMNLL